MENQSFWDKVREVLTPFQTENIVKFLKNLTLKSAMENPWIVAAFLIIFFYAVIKRSKFVLLTLFTGIALMVLVRYTFPANGDELSLKSTLPFVFGALVIGAVVLYFNFIKTE